ncbi:tenecin-1-like [Euwallacea similis]|uniref:tenecin-1-like n=1 Tax=Euwallacea similis TaxID=1736056 RepID=UPI00344C9693
MNKLFVLFAIFATFAVATLAAPVEEVDEVVQVDDDHVIVKRATCDLLSFEIAGAKFNDAACAAHCLALRKKGGHCNGSGVCVCRN